MLVRTLRRQHDWSQEQLAEMSGLSVRTIQRVESGNRASLETLKCLAAVFEVEVAMLTDEITLIDKDSPEWKRLPLWFRWNMFGVDSRATALFIEWSMLAFAASCAIASIVLGNTYGMVLCAVCLLTAYLQSLFVRYGDRAGIFARGKPLNRKPGAGKLGIPRGIYLFVSAIIIGSVGGYFGYRLVDYDGRFSGFAISLAGDVEIETALLPISSITITRVYDPETGVLAYWTGGWGEIQRESDRAAPLATSPAPKHVVATAQSGPVTVRMRAFAEHIPADVEEHAALIAESIARVTTDVWPGVATPVAIDYHIMPGDNPYARRRHVEWREGDPFRIASFMFEPLTGGNPSAHDLYQVLRYRWLFEGETTAAQQDAEGQNFVRIGALLFENCGNLLAGQTVSAGFSRVNLNLHNRAINRIPTLEDLAFMQGYLDTVGPNGGQTLSGPLANAFVRHVLGIEGEIAPGSPEAEALLEGCRRYLPDPLAIGRELRQLIGAAGRTGPDA